MPQSILFSDDQALQSARETFNSHPKLTIFTRDKQSYELSCRYFPNARTILAPDMVFLLAPVFQTFFKKQTKGKFKFLIRADKESVGDKSAARRRICRFCR